VKAYKCFRLDSLNERGIRWYCRVVELVSVEGRDYVRIDNTLIESTKGFRESRGDAIRDMAAEVEQLSDVLRNQAASMRVEAAGYDARDAKDSGAIEATDSGANEAARLEASRHHDPTPIKPGYVWARAAYRSGSEDEYSDRMKSRYGGEW